jgi:hypothetical protein
MNAIPSMDNWKWFHVPLAVGFPLLIGSFFMETTPIFSHRFWIPLSTAVILVGLIGMTSTRKKHNKVTGSWDIAWKNTWLGWGMLLPCILFFSVAVYFAFTE